MGFDCKLVTEECFCIAHYVAMLLTSSDLEMINICKTKKFFKEPAEIIGLCDIKQLWKCFYYCPFLYTSNFIFASEERESG